MVCLVFFRHLITSLVITIITLNHSKPQEPLKVQWLVRLTFLYARQVPAPAAVSVSFIIPDYQMFDFSLASEILAGIIKIIYHCNSLHYGFSGLPHTGERPGKKRESPRRIPRRPFPTEQFGCLVALVVDFCKFQEPVWRVWDKESVPLSPL